MLAVHEPEARIVRLIFRWYTEGDGESGPMPARAIARRLTEMCIPTWNDIHKKAGKRRGYGEWAASTIAYILQSETYIGIWRYSGIPVDVPPIVSPETWDTVQERKKRNLAHAKRNRKYDYLLASHIRCGVCGMSVCGTSKVMPNRVYLYYRCSTAPNQVVGNRTCNLPTFRADLVDMVVWDWTRTFLADPQVLGDGLDQHIARQHQANEPIRERLKVIDDLLSDNRRRMERLLDLHLEEDFPREIAIERKVRLEKTIGELRRERAGPAQRLEAQTLTA
jgi:site-specific DNA recombinase